MNKASLKNILNKTMNIFSSFQKKDKEIKSKIKDLQKKVCQKKTNKEIEEVRKKISEL